MAPDLEAQPPSLTRTSTASRRTSISTSTDQDGHGPEMPRLEQSLSRIQTWALEYVDLDFSVQERALEMLKNTRQEQQQRGQQKQQQQRNVSSSSSSSSSASETGIDFLALSLHISPSEWSLARKTKALLFPCIAALLAGYAAGAYAFAGPSLKPLWSISTVAYNTGITVFVLGFGLAPVVLALLSEIYGRYWIFVCCGVLFFLGTTGCAVSGNSFPGMLVSRFVTGSGASVFATLTAGVVSDLFPNEERHTPMAIYSLCLCAGTGVGPLVSGAIVGAGGGESGRGLSWHWIFYVQMILIAIVTVSVALVFEETRANVLLARNCVLLNECIDQMERESGEIWGYSHNNSDNDSSNSGTDRDEKDGRDRPPAIPSLIQQQEQKQKQRTRFRVPSPSSSPAGEVSLISLVWRSLCFPLQLLATEPIVFCFSAWVSFAWAILYMQFSTIPRVYRDVYGFGDLQLGLVYIAVILGCVVGCLACIAQDKLSSSVSWSWRGHGLFRRSGTAQRDLDARGTDNTERKLQTDKKEKSKPEARIHFACIGTTALPAGLFMFGWTTTTTTTNNITSAPDFPPIVPTVGIAIAVAGIFIIYLAVFNYLADSYGRFASSAQAAQSMCRNFLAGVFPLVADALFDRLGAGGGDRGGEGNGIGYALGETLLGGIAVLLCLVPWILCAYGERIRKRSRFARQLVQ